MPQPHKNHLSFISIALKNRDSQVFKGIQRFKSQVKYQSTLNVTASKLLSNVTNAFIFRLLVALEEKEENKLTKTELIY